MDYQIKFIVTIKVIINFKENSIVNFVMDLHHKVQVVSIFPTDFILILTFNLTQINWNHFFSFNFVDSF